MTSSYRTAQATTARSSWRETERRPPRAAPARAGRAETVGRGLVPVDVAGVPGGRLGTGRTMRRSLKLPGLRPQAQASLVP